MKQRTTGQRESYDKFRLANRQSRVSIAICIFVSWFFSFKEAEADTVLSPIIIREVFVTTEGNMPIKPLTLMQANDGDVIVAGSAGSKAWATRVDQNGKVLWNYDARLEDKGIDDLSTEKLYHELRSAYLGIVQMPDDSSYLCGYQTTSPGGYAPGLITHLDSRGRVLFERLIFPQNRPGRGIARIDRCAKWGERIVLQGHLLDWSQGFNDKSIRNDLYWVIVLDGAGNVQWERTFPISPALVGPDGFSPLFILPDSSLVFSGNKNDEYTEFMRVSAKGDLLSSSQMPGKFQIVQSVLSNATLKIMGWSAEDTSKSMAVLTLNDEFGEISRVQGPPMAFLTRVAYGLPDKSFVLFGSRAHMFGEPYTSQVVHLTSELSTEKTLDPPHNRSPFLDAGSIWAAAPLGKVGEFVYARGLSMASDLGHNAANSLPRGFLRGLELDFIVTE